MSLLKRPNGHQQSSQAVVRNRSAAVRLIGVAAAQRVRLGLTGLAAIFLLVLVTAAGMRPAPSAAPVDSHGEPLAVLGVAPGPGPANFDAKGQPRQAAPRPSQT